MSRAAGLVSDTRRLETYLRGSAYLILAMEPLVLVFGRPSPSLTVIALLALAQTAGNIAVCRWVLISMRQLPLSPRPRVRAALIAWAAWSAVLVIAVLTWMPSVLADERGAVQAALLLLVAVATPVSAIAPLLRPLRLLLVCVGSGIALCLLLTLGYRLDLASALGLSTWMVAAVGFFGFTFWLTGWMLRVVWALEDARTTAARLAIAEERLRIARDLHDLFGRTLAAVSVKSELAAELIRRDHPEAAGAEIAAVRELADQSGREVREVVRGIRGTDLDTELEGARALLESAGIRCVARRIDVGPLPPAAAAALGWVLREAVTNVIRHSRAGECVITLRGPDPVRLEVTNNGATEVATGPGPGGGHGLVGMGERMREVGGHLDQQQVQDRYTVTAELRVAGVPPAGATS